jgi:hypothetical protein
MPYSPLLIQPCFEHRSLGLNINIARGAAVQRLIRAVMHGRISKGL